MKKIVLMVQLLLLLSIVRAQHFSKAEYFIDSDPGIGLANSTALSDASDTGVFSTSFGVNLTGKGSGFHNLGYRIMNNNGIWSIAEFRQFYIYNLVTAPALASLSSYEYFIDIDPGIGNAAQGSFATSDSAAISIPIVLSVSPGFHNIGVRVKNTVGQWSLTETRPFYVYSSVIPAKTYKITNAEYFFDTDPGVGKCTAVNTFTGSDSVSISFAASTANLLPGFHNLLVRVKDSIGRWSLNETRSFYVYSALNTVKTSKIVSGEYYFDSIPKNGQGTAITAFTAEDTVSTSFNIPLGSLSSGNHSLILRFKDSVGVWSMLESRNFYVYQPRKILPIAPLVYLEYFIDADLGYGKDISVPVSKGDTIKAPIVIDVSNLTLGPHTITVRAEDSTGIWSIAETKTFSTCNPLVTPQFSAAEGCAQTPIAMYNYSTGTFTGAKFEWDFNSDGIIDTITTTTTAFNKEFPVGGTYKITLTAIDNANCSSTVTNTLTVDNQPPVPTVLPSGNVTFCQGSLGVKLTSSVNNVVWSPTNETTVSILAGNTGTYYATATDPITGCTANSNVVAVTQGLIKPDFTFSVNQTTRKVTFIDASVGANKWLWRFGDYASGSGHTPTHTYNQPGAYIACQSAYDTINGCSADTCKLVQINVTDSTFAAFSFVAGSGDSVYFKNLSSKNATKFYWTYGNGNYDTIRSPAVNFPTSGIFDVCLRVYDPISKTNSQTCNKVSVGTITCKLNASFSFFADPVTNIVEFSDQSDGDLSYWYWNFGDGSTSTSQNPVHQYTSAGFYLVTLSVSNANNQCIDSYQEFVKVGNGNCKAAFTYFVEGNTVTFTNNSTGSVTGNSLIYYWSFDDGTSSTLINPVVNYAKPGVYNVSLTITNTGGTCSDISVIQVLVGKVVCNASFSYYIDSIQNKVFFAPANALPSDKLFWTFGDGSTDTTKTPSHQFTAPGYFTVGLSLYNTSGCIDNQVQTVLIGREGIDCQSDFIYSVSGSNVSLTDISKGNPTGFLWNFGDKSDNSISKDTSHSYNSGGYYNVCHLIVNKYGISNIKCKPVPVVIPGQFNCLADFNFVVDQSSHTATFVDNSVGNPNKFAWTFGDKLTSADSTPTHTYVNADYFLVGLKITNTSTGCTDQTYKIVNITNIQGKIKAGFGYDPKIYNAKAGGYPVDFVGAGLGDQSRLKWNFGDTTGIDSTTSTPEHVYNVAGTYTVCYYISDPITGQQDSVCQPVTTTTLCTVDVTPPIANCKNITVQ